MLNNTTIMGRLVADPELHNGNMGPFATFTIAVDRDYNRDTTDFFDCLAFAKTAEFVHKYWTKGRLILCKGHLQTNTWIDRNGAKRRDTKIVAENIYFCEGKRPDEPQKTASAVQPRSSGEYVPDVSADDFAEVPDEHVPF